MRLGELRSRRLYTPTRGVRTASAPSTVRERAAAFAAGMPDDAAFSHVSAAQLLIVPLPRDLESQVLLEVTRPTPEVTRPTPMGQVRR